MIGIVPIRAGSKGIPNKNIKLINGKPLVWWILDSLSKSKVDRIIVPVDPTYVDIINNLGIDKVETYLRNPNNSKDTSSTEDVLIEVINELKLQGDILLAQSTSPLTTFQDVNRGIELYKQYDSILSVVNQKRFIWDKNGKSVNYDYTKRPRRQEWEGYFVENGAFYINSTANIKRTKSRLFGKIGLCEMREETYLEIDTEQDWIIIENLLKSYDSKH